MFKSSLHVQAMRTFSIEQAAENERCWTYEQYKRKNADGEKNNHYDWTRREINFKVTLNSEGRVEILPLRPQGLVPTLHTKLQRRLDVLGHKAYKDGARNNPFTCVDIVIGGDQNRMRKMAFGDQKVAFDLSEDNSGIKRMSEIEEWAKDAYEFARKQWGDENIIGMEVHLDESTPHAHVLIIPTAIRKQRGRTSKNKPKEEKLMVSFSGQWGDNKVARSNYTSNLHTLFYEEVGIKYGLERGDVIASLPQEEQLGRIHKNKQQLEAERTSRINVVVNEQYNETLKAFISDNEATLQEQHKSIKERGEGLLRDIIERFKKDGRTSVQKAKEAESAYQQAIIDEQNKGILFRETLDEQLKSAIKERDGFKAKVKEVNKWKKDNEKKLSSFEELKKERDKLKRADTRNSKKIEELTDSIKKERQAYEKTRDEIAVYQKAMEILPNVYEHSKEWSITKEQSIALAKGEIVETNCLYRVNEPEQTYSNPDDSPIKLRWYCGEIECQCESEVQTESSQYSPNRTKLDWLPLLLWVRIIIEITERKLKEKLEKKHSIDMPKKGSLSL